MTSPRGRETPPKPRAPRFERKEGGDRGKGKLGAGVRPAGEGFKPRGDRAKGDGAKQFEKREGGKPWSKDKPAFKGPRRDGARDDKPRSFEARPERRDRIDPDNPFAAALMALRDKT